jgi:hypothetical protein
MFIKALRKQHLAQTALVAVFALSLLVAQLAIVDHDAQHPFHKHTNLCDSFATYDHSKSALLTTSAFVVSVEFFSIHLSLKTQPPLYAASSVIRIRGPPSLLI